MLNASLAGLLTGLSLIVAIGAQNAFVLRQGLRRAHVGPIVAVCTLSDIALIVAGVGGIGAVMQHADWALQAVRWFGVAFLTWYGLSSAWRARHPSALPAPPTAPRPRPAPAAPAPRDAAAVAPTLRRALALTWLNPHVYLDTVVLLGSIANTHGPSAGGGSRSGRLRGEHPVVHAAWGSARGSPPRCSPPRAPGRSSTC